MCVCAAGECPKRAGDSVLAVGREGASLTAERGGTGHRVEKGREGHAVKVDSVIADPAVVAESSADHGAEKTVTHAAVGGGATERKDLAVGKRGHAAERRSHTAERRSHATGRRRHLSGRKQM